MEAPSKSETKIEKMYFAPYCSVEVLTQEDDYVSFALHVGYSCAQKMRWKVERFLKWLDEKGFKPLDK